MKLSICIPTYNRSAYLRILLEKVFKEIEIHSLFKEVQVIVSDNASTDNTQSLCKEFIEKGLIYIRNEENIGADANFLNLFEIASGDYIWLTSDDDSFSDGVLSYVIKAAEKEKFDYFYLRTTGENSNLPDRSYSIVNNIELFGKTTIYTTFISSQIIRAALLKPNIMESKKFLDGYMAYYYIFLKALGNSEVCLISNQKEIYANTKNNTGGYKFYKVWGEAVFDSLYGTIFANNKKLISRFKSDIFFSLILPITFTLRRGGSGYSFIGGQQDFDIKKYFDGFLYIFLFNFYNKSPLPLLAVINRVISIINKIRRNLIGVIR